MAKRIFDLLLSTLGLLITGWLILILIVVVRRNSSGPGIFAQTRVGLGERNFTCYKLRTMSVGAPSVGTHDIGDNFTTPVGRWLRRSKLDELPQLFNVVRGDMSLVGPRPCLPNQTDLIEERRRLGVFAVRPGVTGLGQITGVDMSNPSKLAAVDAEYIRTRTLLGDIVIMFRTIVKRGYSAPIALDR